MKADNFIMTAENRNRSLGAAAALLWLVFPLRAQQPAAVQAPEDSARSVGDASPFRRLELPAATTMRTASGAPGPDYWQQRADYVIRVSLDTVRQTVSGEERITYTNNSPDTLHFLWIQLDQNLFNSSSRGSHLFDRDSRFGTRGAEGGVTLKRVTQPALPARSGRPAASAAKLAYQVNGTVMRVSLPRPLPPRGRQLLDIAWSFPFGPNSNRKGIELIDSSYVYEVAQ